MGNRKKVTAPAKEPVKIRFKELQNGNQSIYFDVYRGGKRLYEFPKLYIVPEKTNIDKEKNRQTLEIANRIKSQKILELANNENGLISVGLKQKANFIEYIKSIAEKKQLEYVRGRTIRNKKQEQNPKRGVYHKYMGLINHLITYKGDKVSFKQVNKEYCIGFNEYLKTAANGSYKVGKSKSFPSGLLAGSTQWGYSQTLSVVLNCAVQEGIILYNPMKRLTRFERPKLPESNREYLTIEELKQLVKTECVKPVVKSAFLFSCFSGLRFGDLKALRWGDIQTDNEGKKVVRYTQQKTKKPENLQLSDEAIKFLPNKNGAKDNDTIFNLYSNGFANSALEAWIFSAGIKKRVTFHCGRHTFACLLISEGVPIEVTSKLLGHSDIKTTQIYTKIMDKNKRIAVSKLDGLTD